MKTALAVVLAVTALALVVEKAIEVLDPGVVEFTSLFNQQQVDPWHIFGLFADVANNHPLIPPKDIDGQVVLPLNSFNLRDWCGSIDPFEAPTIISRVL